MRFFSLQYLKSDNIGDEIQSLAAEQFLPRIDGFVDRDTELHVVSEPTFVFLNGWFKHGPTHWKDDAAECWPPSDQLRPVFFGFHIAYPEALLTKNSIEYYRKCMPIGCRDRETMKMLKEMGVDAYFSRCLTLTFPRREQEPEQGSVYIVEGKRSVLKERVPTNLLQIAENRGHYVHPKHKRNNDLKRDLARRLLHEYRTSAKLVITDLLHCAMPCLAMGIPVVFIPNPQTLEEDSYRLDPVRDLIPVYGPQDRIDWQPRAQDISVVQNSIREEAAALVKNALQSN
jgi:Polysaccharide pyruvyl transferase